MTTRTRGQPLAPSGGAGPHGPDVEKGAAPDREAPDPAVLLEQAIFHEDHPSMVVVRAIDFRAVSERDRLPFHGRVHVGYVPDGRIVGLSKLARVVDALSREPRDPQRLAGQVADVVWKGLRPRGVGVVVEARQAFATQENPAGRNGVRSITRAFRGTMDTCPDAKRDFLLRTGMIR